MCTSALIKPDSVAFFFCASISIALQLSLLLHFFFGEYYLMILFHFCFNSDHIAFVLCAFALEFFVTGLSLLAWFDKEPGRLMSINAHRLWRSILAYVSESLWNNFEINIEYTGSFQLWMTNKSKQLESLEMKGIFFIQKQCFILW